MKKLILIILPVLFLSSSTELHELIRLPLLLEHYGQHRSSDPGLSLLDFLKIHYSGDHPNDNDDNDDNELPFKSDGSLTHIDSPVTFHREPGEKQVFFVTGKPAIQYTEELPDDNPFSIFHPPRFVSFYMTV